MRRRFPHPTFLAAAALFAGCASNSTPAGPASTGDTSTDDSSTTVSTASDTTLAGTEGTSGSTNTTTSASATTDTTGASSETGSGPPAWRPVEGVDGTLGAFYSVWGAASDDLYIVGGRDVADIPSVGVLLHFDGTTWSDQAPPDARTLHWISPAGTDVWVVGQAGVTLRLEDGSWVEHPTPTSERLWGVWGSAPDNVWAVGGEPASPEPLVIHFDGAAWGEPVSLPATDASVAFKVWGSAADSVWVVGADGLALHFDGDSWSLIPNESISDLISVFGNAEQVVAVGGRANARIARLTPGGMEAVTLDAPGASGVWMDSAGVTTFVGDMGMVATLPASGLDPDVGQVGTPLLLHAVFGLEGELWAVGGDHFDATPSVGTVYRFGL